MKIMLIWITGLAGAGKTTIATALYERLKPEHKNLVLLDGDCFREVMGQDVGYDLNSRKIMAKRMSRLCKYLTDQDMHVICACDRQCVAERQQRLLLPLQKLRRYRRL